MDELVVVNTTSKCNFCGTKKNDQLTYGPIYKLGNIKAHYYCVLLSNRLIQNGSDDEGILGFLLSDILKELKRTSRIMCFYCKKGNATIKCASPKCRKSFHLPCGLQNWSLHQFTDQFKSFCDTHRPVQNIPNKILKEACRTTIVCCICYDTIDVKDRKDNLWAPCCVKTWYHRYCVQKLAHSSGYFFRCAACNDVQKFNKWMQRFGIFIPQRDASWELVPHAFEELLFRYNKCDAKNCKCPQGRTKNAENTMWEIVLCGSCGSQGIHVACGNLKFVNPEWECSVCQKITENMKTTVKTSNSVKADAGSSEVLKLSEICRKKRLRDSEENSVLDKRKKCRVNGEVGKEGENEVDVETVDEEPRKDDNSADKVDYLEELIDVEFIEEKVKPKKKVDFQKVRPGPLSYKLSLIGTCGNLQSLNNSKVDTKMDQPVIELIEISDSEEDDIEVIENCGNQTPEKPFHMIYGVMNVDGNQKESSDKNICLMDISKSDEKRKLAVADLEVEEQRLPVANVELKEQKLPVVTLEFEEQRLPVADLEFKEQKLSVANLEFEDQKLLVANVEFKEQKLPVVTLEVVSAFDLWPKEKPNDIDQNTLHAKNLEEENISCDNKNSQDCLSSPTNAFAQNFGKEVSNLDSQLNKTDFEEKKANKSPNSTLESCSHKPVKRSFDDEVIILSD